MSLLSKLRGMLPGQSGAEYQRRYVAVDARAKAHAELQRDIALAGVSENHPVWQAVLNLVDENAQNELDGSLSPNLTNEQRQFASGAAANADYVCKLLRDARLLASQKVKSKKMED